MTAGDAPAAGLERRPPGIWFAQRQGAVSYPEGGHAACLEVEDSSFWFRHRNRCIVSTVKRFAPAGRLLDVGGGNGYVARGLAEAGFACTLLEPGLEGALAAHARGIDPVVCARLEDAGFAPRSFGAAGLFDVLEHIEDEATVLGEIRRLLAPRAPLFITVPAFQALFSAEDVEAGHYRRYTAVRLGRVLDDAGFEMRYRTYLFWPLPLPILVLRTLPSRLGLKPRGPLGQHAPSGPAAWLMDRALDAEFQIIKRSGRVPVGASVLAVATARA